MYCSREGRTPTWRSLCWAARAAASSGVAGGGSGSAVAVIPLRSDRAPRRHPGRARTPGSTGASRAHQATMLRDAPPGAVKRTSTRASPPLRQAHVSDHEVVVGVGGLEDVLVLQDPGAALDEHVVEPHPEALPVLLGVRLPLVVRRQVGVRLGGGGERVDEALPDQVI